MPRSRPWLYFRVALFLLVVPGSVVGYIPAAVIRRSGVTAFPALTPVSALSVLCAIAGAAILLFCAGDFAAVGEGTPAPVDPPRALVVRRLYRFTRNPMYCGIIIILGSESAFFSSVPLLVYALMISLLFHLFVVFCEERALRRKFGADYERYCATIPRWWVSFRPYA